MFGNQSNIAKRACEYSLFRTITSIAVGSYSLTINLTALSTNSKQGISILDNQELLLENVVDLFGQKSKSLDVNIADG